MKKKYNISISYFSIYAAIILLLISCAHIVNPSGGPKDVTPPKPIKCIPANYSVHFNQNKIEILFNEFILLKDLKNQMLISPPLKEVPDIKVKGKTLVIEIKEKLRENTTYTLFFGDAIIDLTEGNALSTYEYVFSTANSLDSMTLTGRVVNSFTQKPEKDFFVMLYDQTYDSIPYKEKPYYLAKTRENGEYSINNLRNIPYKIFALKDVNNNFIYDQPAEKIAFSDSLVFPHIKPIIKFDSTRKDSLRKDSLKLNTDIFKKFSISELRSFQEIDSTQRLLNATFIKKGQILFAFRYPVKNLKIDILDKPTDNKWKIEEWNTTKDSLIYWILKPEIDTLHLIINDNNQFIDTLLLRLKQKTVKLPAIDTSTAHLKQKNTKIVVPTIVKVSPFTNLSQTFDFYNPICFEFPNPMLKHDSVPVLLIEAKDSLKIFAYAVDAVHRKFLIKKDLKQSLEYSFILKEDLLTDIFEYTNDSLHLDFKTNSVEDVGNFMLNINLKDTIHSYIIQLMNEREQILEQRFIDKSTKLKFKNLAPATYLIKAIVDVNKNKNWDNGNYLQKIQAEKVIIYPSKITIRANWDLDENWEL
ncbi:MAG: Ig-like domain-containing protein [Bacteroidota bacterium]